MKPRAAVLCLLLAAGAGFSLQRYVENKRYRRLVLERQGEAALRAEEAGRASAKKAADPEPAAAPESATDTADPAQPSLFPELAGAEDCVKFLTELDALFRGRNPLLRDAARDYALRRWLELDAESALAAAERGGGGGPLDIGRDLFRVWLDLDPDSALSAWNQAGPALAGRVRDSLLATLAQTDPGRALTLLATPRGKTGEGHFSHVAQGILRLWGMSDPRAALAAMEGKWDALSSAEKPFTRQDRVAVFEGWAARDPAGLLAFARSGKDPECTVESVAASLIPALLKTDPATAATLLREEKTAGRGLANKWAQADPMGALEWADGQGGNSRLARELKVLVGRELATADPERALTLLDGYLAGGDLREGFTLTYGYREVFASLAATDPDRAKQLIAADPARARMGAMNGYMARTLAADPAAALAQAREWMRVPALARDVPGALLMAYDVSNGAVPRDFSPVLAAMPELASRVDSRILEGWAMAAPESAAEFLAARAAAGDAVQGVAETGVLARIANGAPEWTSAWVSALPDGVLRNEAAAALTANWSNYDPAAASAWLATLPPGPARAAAQSAWDRRLEVPRNVFQPGD